jgi:hypothetical protein
MQLPLHTRLAHLSLDLISIPDFRICITRVKMTNGVGIIRQTPLAYSEVDFVVAHHC